MNNISDGSIVNPIVLNIRGLTPVRAYKSVVRQLREIRDRMKMQPKYDIEESKTTEQIRWEENHNARLEAANHKMALAFNEGFKLRTAVKSINKGKSAYFTN